MVLLSFTGFYLVLLGFRPFYWVLLGFHRVSLGSSRYYFVLLVSTRYYWILLDFTGFYWALLVFTGFYWDLLGFTGFLTRFWPREQLEGRRGGRARRNLGKQGTTTDKKKAVGRSKRSRSRRKSDSASIRSLRMTRTDGIASPFQIERTFSLKKKKEKGQLE